MPNMSMIHISHVFVVFLNYRGFSNLLQRKASKPICKNHGRPKPYTPRTPKAFRQTSYYTEPCKTKCRFLVKAKHTLALCISGAVFYHPNCLRLKDNMFFLKEPKKTKHKISNWSETPSAPLIGSLWLAVYMYMRIHLTSFLKKQRNNILVVSFKKNEQLNTSCILHKWTHDLHRNKPLKRRTPPNKPDTSQSPPLNGNRKQKTITEQEEKKRKKNKHQTKQQKTKKTKTIPHRLRVELIEFLHGPRLDFLAEAMNLFRKLFFSSAKNQKSQRIAPSNDRWFSCGLTIGKSRNQKSPAVGGCWIFFPTQLLFRDFFWWNSYKCCFFSILFEEQWSLLCLSLHSNRLCSCPQTSHSFRESDNMTMIFEQSFNIVETIIICLFLAKKTAMILYVSWKKRCSCMFFFFSAPLKDSIPSTFFKIPPWPWAQPSPCWRSYRSRCLALASDICCEATGS